MLFESYFDRVIGAIELVIAFGSLIGLLGFIVSILAIIFADSRHKKPFIYILLLCILLMGVCGVFTGVKYFRIHH